MDTFETIKLLTETLTVSGFEKQSAQKIIKIARDCTGDFFDSAKVSPTGSVVLSHSCKKPGARRFLLDAHIDTIGFAVSELCGEGFVRVCPVGGIDVNILPACEVLLYGKKTVRGFFTSVPPHLAADDKLPKISELLVDTGIPDSEINDIIPVGTPVGFASKTTRLLNGRIASPSLDDKLCAAAILRAASMLCGIELCSTDVYVIFSVGEEKTSLGAKTAFELTKPDAALVLDVNFADSAGTKPSECLKLGGGAGVSISSTTSRRLTEFIQSTAKKHGLPCQFVVEITSTGTNATQLARQGHGVPTAVLSLPLRYMHTCSETAALSDLEDCAKLLAAVISEYDKDNICVPVYIKKRGDGRE